MNYRRAFVPNGYLHIIITSYDRKPIFIENIDILRTAFKNTKAGRVGNAINLYL